MFKFKFIASVIAVGMMVNFFVNLNFNSPEEEINTEDAPEISANQPRKIKIPSRYPASSIKTKHIETYQPEIKRSELDQSNFENTADVSAPRESSSPVVYRGGQARTPVSIPLIRENVSEPPKKTASNSSINTSLPVFPPPPTKCIPPECVEPPPPPKPDDPVVLLPPDIITCSANIAGGTFSYPIAVTLSCSSVSTIRYCLALDTGAGCCDPASSGTTYVSQIVVAPQDGNYCLSYYGESQSAGRSVDYGHSYTINSTIPNFQVAHPQINYQTTQLNGKTFVTSTNFGNLGFGIGQINLKAHDPGPTGLNYTCDDIMANYVSLTAPAPITILSLLDVSLDNPALQIEIPLQATQLDYGDNFITSYIENSNNAIPVYSCSTSKVVLFDFEFFQEELAFGYVGNNVASGREFTGGFSAFGFFEDQATVYRGPAGVDTQDNSGQKLQYGMFGIFY